LRLADLPLATATLNQLDEFVDQSGRAGGVVGQYGELLDGDAQRAFAIDIIEICVLVCSRVWAELVILEQLPLPRIINLARRRQQQRQDEARHFLRVARIQPDEQVEHARSEPRVVIGPIVAAVTLSQMA